TALLSPFDSLVWCRPRIARLFDFDYRIEIYTPAPKRKFGYYVLPFLYDGRLVGRFDLKADRQASVLRVQASHIEEQCKGEAGDIALAAAKELQLMADWLGLGAVMVEQRGALARELRRSVA
ncbi:MAG: DNA glycosylase AlkZ-like family protein, partial [Actinomycetota bacterium]